MQLLAFLVASANGPYTVSVGIALVFSILQVSGMLSLFSGGDGDHEADGDADVDGDVDGDADADADGDADGDHDADHDADQEIGAFGRIFGPLGVGKIPLSFIWQSFLVVFGVTGIVLNSPHVGEEIPVSSLVWTLPVSFLVSYGVMAVIARLLAPVLSSKEQEATRLSELNGLEGVVISSKVNREFGEVRIKDRSGHVLRLVCRLEPGHEDVPEGQSVVVVGRESAYLKVIPLELPGLSSTSRRTAATDSEKR